MHIFIVDLIPALSKGAVDLIPTYMFCRLYSNLGCRPSSTWLVDFFEHMCRRNSAFPYAQLNLRGISLNLFFASGTAQLILKKSVLAVLVGIHDFQNFPYMNTLITISILLT